jgi:hypothetical protein
MNISAQTNDKILIFFSEDPPWKALQKLYEQIPIDSSIHLSKISFFSRKKNRVFLAVDDKKGLKTLSKKGCPIKNYSVSERGELGLSSHAFISISIFLTKTDFFEGGGGLKLNNFHFTE